jgi:hypothetical protein
MQMETFQHPPLTESVTLTRADELQAGMHIITAGGYKITAITQIRRKVVGPYVSPGLTIYTLDHRGYELAYSTTPSRLHEVVKDA